MPKKLGIFDYILVIFVLSLMVLFSIFLHQNKIQEDLYVEITYDKGKIMQPIHKIQTIPVDGLTGKVIVSIQNGKVRVISSNCPDQICVKVGWISKTGPMILCAPNHVLVRIINRNQRALITY